MPSLIVPAKDETLVEVGVSVSTWPLSTTDVVFDASSDSEVSCIVGVEHEVGGLTVDGAADAAKRETARIDQRIGDVQRQRAGFDIGRAGIGLRREQRDIGVAGIGGGAVVDVERAGHRRSGAHLQAVADDAGVIAAGILIEHDQAAGVGDVLVDGRQVGGGDVERSSRSRRWCRQYRCCSCRSAAACRRSDAACRRRKSRRHIGRRRSARIAGRRCC